MKARRYCLQVSPLIACIGLVGLGVAGCNKQPNPPAGGTAAQAPPIAALPLAAATVAPAPTAPPANALPPPTRRVAYTPPPPSERYGYIDRAYSMADAFGDTPPDYTVDYQGTRPWIWRGRNGGYRIVERLPRGQRIYYYGPGQDQPFLVRDPEYSYAYDGGRLVGIYGPNGAELGAAMAARRADEASRYFERSRDLYRAAQYQRRQSAYASEWAARRDELRAEHRMWEEQQAQNADWRAWHDAHMAQEEGQWREERDQRLAYAAAVGIPTGPSRPLPRPDELARRQAAFFANQNARGSEAPPQHVVATASSPTTAPQGQTKPVPPVVKGPPMPVQSLVGQQAQTEAAQAKAAQAAQAEKAAAEAKQKEAAAAQMKAAQAAQAQKAAADAKQKEAATAQAKAAQAMEAQKAAAEAKQKEAAASQQKAAEAAKAEKAAAEAKQREASAAEAKAAQAEKAAAEAKQKEAAAAQAKAAGEAEAQRSAAEAKQHEAAAAKANAQQIAQAQKSPPVHASKPQPPESKSAANGSRDKAGDKKDHQAQKQ